MNRHTRITRKVLPLLAIIALSISSIAAAAPAAAGNGFSADVAISDIYPGNQPHGQFWVRVTNHGPGTMHNVHVDIVCGYDSMDVNTGMMGPSQQRHMGVTLNLNPGQTQEFATGLNLDTNVYEYQVGCQVNAGFHDPNHGNNFYSEHFKGKGGSAGGGKPGNQGGQFTADLAVTDMFAGNQPHGQFFVRITNHGPGTLSNVNVQVSCSAERSDKSNGNLSSGGNRNFNVKLNMSPGQTREFATGLSLDTNVFDYLVGCEVHPGFNDPNPGNNVYGEMLH
jgi:hypothetical protein